LEEVDDKVRLIKVLQREAATGEQHKMWVLGKNAIQLIPITFQKVDLENELCWATTVVDDEFEERHSLLPNIRVKVYFQNSSFFIFSKVKTYKQDSNLLKFSFPEVGFFKERRQEERHLVEDLANLDFAKAEPWKSITSTSARPIKKIFDISGGGLSFLLGKGETLPLNEGDRVTNVLLKIAGKKLNVTLEVTKILKITPFIFESIPYGNRKVCCQIIFSKDSDKPKWSGFLKSLFTSISEGGEKV
jgi:hypothetical protein